MSLRHTVPAQMLRVLGCPRLAACGAGTALALFLARLPFAALPTVPHYMGFNPGIALVPLAAVFWGPAAAWAAAAASVAGDAACGLWGPLTPFRAAGMLLYALATQHLWDAMESGAASAGHPARWGRTARFLFVAWPGALVAATWPAIGAEWRGLYPFPYFFALLAVQHVVFVTALGVALYRLVAREIVPHTGTWREMLGDPLPPRLHRGWRVGAAWFLALAPPAAGLAVAVSVYGMRWNEPYVLGTRCGPFVPLVVLPLLAVQAAVHLVPLPRAAGGSRGDAPAPGGAGG